MSMGSVTKAQTELDVLVLYTLGVRSSYGGQDGVAAQVLNSIVSSNLIFERSEISIRLKARAIEYIKYSESQTDMGDDLDFITESSEVAAMRDEVGADLVCLFRKGSVDDTAGIAWQLGSGNGRPERAFSVVSVEAAASGYTFTHEIGHNLGGAHDRDNSEGGGLYPFSHGHRYQPEDGPQRRTVMAYAPGWISGHISNPDVIHDEVPTGIASGDESADNARGFNLIASTVEGYRDHIHILPVAVAGDDVIQQDYDGDSVEEVLLDGSLSSAEESIVSWEWSWSGGSASGEVTSGVFPLGETLVTLSILDDEGFLSESTKNINIIETVPVVSIAAGYEHTLLLQSDGSLAAFGDKSHGKLGFFWDGRDGGQIQFDPLTIASSGVVSVAAGYNSTLFLKSDGSVWGSGLNQSGELGLGTRNWVTEPRRILKSHVTAISAGRGHNLFLKSDGSVWGAGSGLRSQLGLGDSNEDYLPFEIIDSGVIAIDAGSRHSLFVKGDGSLWIAGLILDHVMQEGIVEVVTSGVRSVSAGENHILIVKDDGSLWGLGEDGDGQLGPYANNGNFDLPVKIVDSGVESAVAGNRFSLFIKGDGSLWQMGRTRFENDRTGGETIAKTPQIKVATNVASVVAGYGHAFYRTTDGRIWAFGNNDMGQLGDGMTDDFWEPKRVFSSSLRQNSKPTANAGEDVLVLDHDGDGFASVSMNGSASFDDWFVRSYTWTWESGSAIGAEATIEFSSGQTEVTLTVSDDSNVLNSDTALVTVADASLYNQTRFIDSGDQLWLAVESYTENLRYTLLSSNNLIQWEPVQTTREFSNGALLFEIDADVPRFYRVQIDSPF